MNNTLYLECYSGISGDMTVAALLDLGADRKVLEKALQSLPVDGFKVEISRVIKAGLDVCDFRVILDEEHENHDHDMNYLHGIDKQHSEEEHNHEHVHPQEAEHNHEHVQHSEEEHNHEHAHPQEEEHNHEHVHPQEEELKQEHSHQHKHEHRGLLEVLEVINHADITPKAKDTTTRIFTILAQAEAKAHGVEMNQVHFHEVGAVDSIVDIVAVCVCLDNLNITEVIVPEIYEGRGFVRCQHGIIPIPVPAVVHIAAAHGLQLHVTNTEGELVTPTGAAIVAAIRTSDKLPQKFSIERMGIGAGKRTYDRPSMLRAMLINSESTQNDTIYKLETNIDDSNGEILGFVMERLFEAGARDVHYIPVYMKKNRPAYQLNVICKEEEIAKLEQIIFEETTTIGIRRIEMERTILERKIISMQMSLGEVQIKACKVKSVNKIYPEYSSVVELCKKHNMTYQEVYHRIQEECKEVEVTE
ncbi:MAG: nickel pincer cofactor biosynthesis protein LarC [Lachnotalea sp.]